MKKSNQLSCVNDTKKPEPVLTGKRIIFLGSSVTYGSAANGCSFVEVLEEENGILSWKEAVSGTLLVEEDVPDGRSYIARMKTIDPAWEADAFVCQLSTNDATREKPLGSIALDECPEHFDTKTITGAIESIIAYAKKTWNCPVIFYTGTRYDSRRYQEMVDRLLQLKEKWKIGVIDLWNDPEMNAVSPSDYSRYMSDPIHPTKVGYRDWWKPKFEWYLKDFLQK